MSIYTENLEAWRWYRDKWQRLGWAGSVAWADRQIARIKRIHQEWLERISRGS